MANTRQEILAADQAFLLEMAKFPNIEEIRYKEELTEAEKGQIGFMLITFVRMRESNWTQYQNGVLDEDTWRSYRNSIVAMMSTPNGKKFWQNYVVAYNSFDQRFISHVNDRLAAAPVKERSNITTAFD